MTLVLKSKEELRTWRKAQSPTFTVGLVPTMGALHEGHLSLIQLAKEKCKVTLATIFVNPLQFGPKEDFSAYPRTFEKDLSMLGRAKVDVLFAPESLYLADNSTYVIEEKVSQPLCGAFRPGHFRGVATVVLKLFNLIQPDKAFFGQKDAQQCMVIERMVRDLDLPIQIVRGKTLRETDGLAMSSRNSYLSAQERAAAPLLFKSMIEAAQLFMQGEKDPSVLRRAGRAILEADPVFQIQYWDVRHPNTLEEISEVGPDGALIAVAALLGKTRLIDNLRI